MVQSKDRCTIFASVVSTTDLPDLLITMFNDLFFVLADGFVKKSICLMKNKEDKHRKI